MYSTLWPQIRLRGPTREVLSHVDDNDHKATPEPKEVPFSGPQPPCPNAIPFNNPRTKPSLLVGTPYVCRPERHGSHFPNPRSVTPHAFVTARESADLLLKLITCRCFDTRTSMSKKFRSHASTNAKFSDSCIVHSSTDMLPQFFLWNYNRNWRIV